MYNEKQIENIFKVINIEPDEYFSIVDSYGTIIVEKAYISERLYLVDYNKGTDITNLYLMNIMRGVLKVKKYADMDRSNLC